MRKALSFRKAKLAPVIREGWDKSFPLDDFTAEHPRRDTYSFIPDCCSHLCGLLERNPLILIHCFGPIHLPVKGEGRLTDILICFGEWMPLGLPA